MRPTLDQLALLLQDEDGLQPLTIHNCERYGSKTYVYIRCRHLVQRARVEETLTAAGVWVNPRYCRRQGGCKEDSPIIEARVRHNPRARGE
jgi:hypothetical protein